MKYWMNIEMGNTFPCTKDGEIDMYMEAMDIYGFDADDENADINAFYKIIEVDEE